MKRLLSMNLVCTALLVCTQMQAETATAEQVLGSYVGWFEKENQAAQALARDNKINVTIEGMSDTTVTGRSIVAGNDRPFSGSIRAVGRNFVVDAREPGDDQYDGAFQFTIKPYEDLLQGTWTPNKPTASVTRTKYTLKRTHFQYDAGKDLPANLNWATLYSVTEDWRRELLTAAVTRVNASKALLTKEDLQNMYKGDLEVLRNSIYARHGYSFTNRKMRYVFDKIEWYVPMSTDVRTQLTDLEKKNIDLIKRYEEHAANYYNRFGR